MPSESLPATECKNSPTRRERNADVKCALATVFLASLLLWALLGARPARAQGRQTTTVELLTSGIHCGLLVECTRFDQIGLHVSAGAALQTASAYSRWSAQGAARLALTALDLAEVGVSFAGRISQTADPGFAATLLPVALCARLRLLPLPLPRLALAPLRLAVTYHHELGLGPLGGADSSGAGMGTLRFLAGQSISRLDVDGGVGVTLMRADQQRPRAVAFELSAMASLWLWRAQKDGPSEEFRLTAEALVRFPLERTIASEQNVLLGFLGQSPRGYGGGVSVGTQVVGSQPGLLVLGRMQVSWGKHYQNPWAERKAAEPKTTPTLIWRIIGAIDPVLGADGCVWTDPSPQRPSSRWFCVGTPDPKDPTQIILADGKRLAVGTHLWELRGSLRLDDGSKLVQIPLQARFRKAVWDYLDEHQRQYEHDKEAHRQRICAGKVGMLHGLDGGTAAMAGLDDQGGQAAMLGAELVRQMYCDKDKSPEEQALGLLGAVAGLRGHGPLRARMPMRGEEAEALAGEAAASKARGGAPSGGVAEHTVPPRLGAVILSAEAREHLLYGNLDKQGESKGWHVEKTGEAEKGTYVIEGTRSVPDSNGVYRANAVILGVKKKAMSSFFPGHWTIDQVETAIEEAYKNRTSEIRLGRFRGTTEHGMVIEMDVNSRGQIQTAYPVHGGAK